MSDVTRERPRAAPAQSLPFGTVTFLFTDVVGSTALWEDAHKTMGPAMARHDELIDAATRANGGVVVQPRGEGDSRFLVFSRATDAAATALGIVAAFHREQWSTPAPLRVRIAVHTGETDVRDGDYYGATVNRCARLRSLAAPGQILLSQAAAELVRAATPDGATLHDLGAHVLRDLHRPERVFQLSHLSVPQELTELPRRDASSPATAGERDLPLALAAAPASDPTQVFVGRDAELAELVADFAELRAGPAALALIDGEAGIGKTALGAAFARTVHAAEATVLYGRCDEELGVPYQPWIDVLTQLVSAVPHAAPAGLADLVPAIREVVAGSPTGAPADPETDRYLLFGAIATFFATASAATPIVIVIDDLHWADRATLSLLRHVVSADVGMRVQLVGTYRKSDLRRGDALSDALAHLWRVPGVRRIALRGLDDQGVLALLAAGTDVDPGEGAAQLAHLLTQETNGNPFFAREIVRHLAETGAITRVARQSATSIDLSTTRLPSSVREVVGERVARLSDEARRLLNAAAVIGREFDLDLVARVIDRSDDELLDAFDETREAAMVLETPGGGDHFSFSHALIQRVIYQDIGAARRGRLHRRVAEALEDVCGPDGGDRVGELAHQWAAATAPIQPDKAIGWACRAGDRALSALAPDEAVRWYSRALDLLDDSEVDSVRCDVLIGLGVGQLRTGQAAHRATLLDAARVARTLGDRDRLIAAALANHRGWQAAAGTVDAERVDVLTAALDVSSPGELRVRIQLLSTLAVELAYSGDLDRIRTLADEAVAVARRLDDPASLVRALTAHHQALRIPDSLATRISTTREAAALADALGDLRASFSAHQQLLQAAIETGDRETRDESIAVCHEIASRIKEPYLLWVDLQNRATQALLDGDPDGAETLAGQCFALGEESGQPDALMIYGVELLDVRIHQGRAAELIDAVLAAVAENPGIPSLRAAAARGCIDADRLDDARALLDEGRDLAYDDLWLVGTSMWAQVAARIGDLDSAAVLYERLAPWAGQIPSAVVVAQEPVDHCLGELAAVLGDQDRARKHFVAAEAAVRRFGVPYWTAHTLIEAARLDMYADPVAAASRATEAVALADRCGYERLRVEAEGILVETLRS